MWELFIFALKMSTPYEAVLSTNSYTQKTLIFTFHFNELTEPLFTHYFSRMMGVEGFTVKNCVNLMKFFLSVF